MFDARYDESLNTVLRLEVERYNVLLLLVRSALQNLRGALSGQIIMSLEIEQTLESVRSRAVPLAWLKQVRLSTIIL